MADKVVITVKSFCENPGPRYISQGDDSGEKFYHDVLNKAFYDAVNSKKKLIVNLDSTSGYASSFLDEAFGNLIFDFGKELVENNVEIISNEEPEWKDMIFKETFAEWESRRENNQKPTKSERHEKWYRYIDKKFVQSE